jgi:hypothetical protein
MFALGQEFAEVTQFVRTMRGGSHPILVQASDGLLYVAKFTNNPQGANVPFNESAGAELYRSYGLAVPSWKPLLLTDTFLDANRECWMQNGRDPIRPQAGLCFGTRFLGTEEGRLLEILPETSYKRIRNNQSFWLAWLIDICAQHTDNRQTLFLRDADGWLNAWFVDQGNLFGGPNGGQRAHFVASRYLDPRIYQGVSFDQIQGFRQAALSLDADRLWQRVQTLPDNWKTESALDSFAQCLSKLATASLLQDTLETMVEAQRRVNGCGISELRGQQKPPMSVLRPGIQAAGLERRFGARPASHPVCA